MWKRFCNTCKAEISVQRLRRGAHFCSDRCRQIDRNIMRDEQRAQTATARVQMESHAKTGIEENESQR